MSTSALLLFERSQFLIFLEETVSSSTEITAETHVYSVSDGFVACLKNFNTAAFITLTPFSAAVQQEKSFTAN